MTDSKFETANVPRIEVLYNLAASHCFLNCDVFDRTIFERLLAGVIHARTPWALQKWFARDVYMRMSINIETIQGSQILGHKRYRELHVLGHCTGY